MNPICPRCKVLMYKSSQEYYCPKCGLVIEDFNLQPEFDKERGSFAFPYLANLPQTMLAGKWVKHRFKKLFS